MLSISTTKALKEKEFAVEALKSMVDDGNSFLNDLFFDI
jgi:hypothetical protein